MSGGAKSLFWFKHQKTKKQKDTFQIWSTKNSNRRQVTSTIFMIWLASYVNLWYKVDIPRGQQPEFQQSDIRRWRTPCDWAQLPDWEIRNTIEAAS